MKIFGLITLWIGGLLIGISIGDIWQPLHTAPHFTGEWVMREGFQDKVISDTAVPYYIKEKDSVKYIVYYGRKFVSQEEVERILAEHRERCAEVLNYYKNR